MPHRLRLSACRIRAAAIVAVAAASALAPPAAWAQSRTPARTDAAAPAADVEVLLRTCPAEAHRNAKLYALRAHRIDLMKRSADRQQARSAFSAEQQMSGLIEPLRGRAGIGADLQRIEDTLTALTELTIQEPLAAQIPAAEGLADRAASACQSVLAALKTPDASPAAPLLEVVTGLHFRAQRLGRTYLAAQLTRQVTPQVIATTRDDMAAFEVLLGTLRQAGAADARLREATTLVAGQWVFMKQALTHAGDPGRSRLEDVGRASEHLFEILQDQLVRLRAEQRAGGAAR